MNKPKELHIEASNNCQAKCAMCTRTGMDLDIANIKLDWFRRNIDPMELEKILFCGNLGDPCMNKRLLEICQWLKEQNPDIVLGINTNGALQSKLWWIEMAKTLSGVRDYVVFSIDGTEKTNHIYRKGVAWHRIMENATAFIEAGGNAHWDMLVFDHNKHEVDECIEAAKEMGFSWFRVKETARWDTYSIGFDGLFPASNEWKEHQYLRKIDCEANRDQSRYYDAHGNEWPCCHMAEAYNMRGNEDIKKFSNDELLDNYNERLQKIPYDICVKTCGTTARTGQWKREIEFWVG